MRGTLSGCVLAASHSRDGAVVCVCVCVRVRPCLRASHLHYNPMRFKASCTHIDIRSAQV